MPPARAAEIVAAARGVPVLGVFGGQPVEEILDIAGAAGLAGAQLHGDYRREDAARLRAAGLEVWRVVRIAAPPDLDRLEEATTRRRTPSWWSPGSPTRPGAQAFRWTSR